MPNEMTTVEQTRASLLLAFEEMEERQLRFINLLVDEKLCTTEIIDQIKMGIVDVESFKRGAVIQIELHSAEALYHFQRRNVTELITKLHEQGGL